MKHQFDTSVRPQDDFFGYVNNPWLKANSIPPTESSWGTFYVLRDESWKAVHAILDELHKSTPDTHEQRLLKSLYDSALNYEKNTEAHLATIGRELRRIDGLTRMDLPAYLGSAHRAGHNMFWSGYVDLDDKNSKHTILRLHQAGINMPNRDYYLEKSKQMQTFRSAYRTYHQTLRDTLPDHMTADFETVFAIETMLAKAMLPDADLRDVQKAYNPSTIEELTEHHPSFDWEAYFTTSGWKPNTFLSIDQPGFVAVCIDMLANQPIQHIKHYLTWQLLQSFVSWTSKETSAASFAFYGKTLNGTKKQQPLWKRAVLRLDGSILGEVLGREYAKRHFPETSKQAVLQLVEEIRAAYHTRIDKLSWMKAETKQRAHTKLDNMKVFIGYPNVWKTFDALSLSPDNMLENLIALHEFASDHELAKVGHPPAEEEWFMNAHTVNAYNSPNRLEIVFPAAILQPPFYDPQASHAANLGGIGAVIGHEFTHSFDDQGCEYDEDGNTHRWQSDEERGAFASLAQHIVEQADAFETVPGVFLQGKLILGEAIADIGGLQLALSALQPQDDPKELFVTFARCECGKATKERLIQFAKIDPHPPSPFRVNCVVPHVDEFYETYEVTSTDALYLDKKKRSQIW